ncbi:reverse transcriptase domain-containing protein [Tanacetum coccineum]
MLVSLEGKEYTYALRFEFNTTKNEAEYEQFLAGLRIIIDMKIKDLTIFVDSQVVSNLVKGLFETRHPVIKQYLEKTKEVLRNFDSYTMKHVRMDQNKKADTLSKPALTTFSRLAKEVLVEVLAERSIVQRELKALFKKCTKAPVACMQCHGPLPIALGGARFLVVAIDYITKRVETKPLVSITGKHMEKFVWEHIVSRFGVPQIIIFDNGKKNYRRLKEVEVRKNDKRRRENLDILEEWREIASIREAHYIQKLERYYNKRVRRSTFKPVRKAYGDRAYKLETLSGSSVDQTWNGLNLLLRSKPFGPKQSGSRPFVTSEGLLDKTWMINSHFGKATLEP